MYLNGNLSACYRTYYICIAYFILRKNTCLLFEILKCFRNICFFSQALTLSNESRKDTTVGEIVNLMSVDAQRLQDVAGYLWMVWSSPLQIIIAVYMLWGIVGPSVLAGLAIMVLLIPVNGILATIQRNLQVTFLAPWHQIP